MPQDTVQVHISFQRMVKGQGWGNSRKRMTRNRCKDICVRWRRVLLRLYPAGRPPNTTLLTFFSHSFLQGKFEEKEDSVPKLEQLNSLGCMTNMNLVLTKQTLLHMELLLLETFQWNLCLPTAAHFIEYYLSEAVHETDLHDGWPMVCLEKTKLYMAKYADYFLEVSLQGEWLRVPSGDCAW